MRAIASMLIDVPKSRKGPLAQQVEHDLSAFLHILTRLERVSNADSESESPEYEDADSRHWVDLRECRIKFAEHGGVI